MIGLTTKLRGEQAGCLIFRWSTLCTPGMGVNLWGESPLYVNPANVKILAEVPA